MTGFVLDICENSSRQLLLWLLGLLGLLWLLFLRRLCWLFLLLWLLRLFLFLLLFSRWFAVVLLRLLLLLLLLLWLLARFFIPQGGGQPQSAPSSTVPTPNGNAPSRPAPRDGGADRDVLRFLIVGTVALLAMIVAGAITSARQRRVGEPRIAPSDTVVATAPTVTPPALARAAESGLAEIEDPNHEPRQAIIACYAAMERDLSRFPGAVPQDFDTPTEVLARAAEHHALNADCAVELVHLFEEARFSPHVMDESHRASALRVLRLVLAELRSAV